MKPDSYYAHTLEGQPPNQWERLEDHLECVRQKAGEFADAFGSRAWGELAGLWHDLGKYHRKFQDRLRGAQIQVEHAGAGAALAVERFKQNGIALAFAIAGHHAGLANYSARNRSDRTPLMERIKVNEEALTAVLPLMSADLRDAALPDIPAFLRSPLAKDAVKRRIELWTRFLFSSLVDADRIETARFYAKHDPSIRSHEELRYDAIPVLSERLDKAISKKALGSAPTPVNVARAEILSACRSAAKLPRGRFSLTVPTGGGKTLSAMSFTLDHAARHGMDRVIVVIPYTSIIEQNARIYRQILDNPACPDAVNVVEHHSNLDTDKRFEENSSREIRRRLSAENWDAPVIVTTTVQFFESLLSDHPSRCRKLHNIANSVIILDEVQMLPPQFLDTITEVLSELTEVYGCTVVLSTATPPALKKDTGPGKTFGLTEVREIIPNPSALSDVLRRVVPEWRVAEAVDFSVLAVEIKAHHQVLAIVDRREDARELASLVGADVFHLSGLMCPAHRTAVLDEVRERLRNNKPCRLISTQLIEAGVDVDFPIVYRALAGIDSLAQAAGRCDREGLRTLAGGGVPAGRLVIFKPPKGPPRPLKKAVEATTLLRSLAEGGAFDIFDPATQEKFFVQLYSKHDTDRSGVQSSRERLDFADTAAAFRLIEDNTYTVVCPYNDVARQIIDRVQVEEDLTLRRALQPFTVTIYSYHAEQLVADGVVQASPLDERLLFPTILFSNRYHPDFGLTLGSHPADPNLLIA